MKISATIISLDEERRIEPCLSSIRDVVDEVVLVDSGSRDRTCQIAEQIGAKIVVHPWSGYSAQKNFAADCAAHEWILSVDADERLSPELRERLLALKNREPEADAYAFPRRAHYLGRWIRHSGWYPDYKTRLYRKNKGRWVGEFVHESLVVSGQISRIEGDLLHYTCDSVTEHLRRMDRYTALAAQAMRQQGRRFSLPSMIGSPLAVFFKTYLLKSGFRDGIQGLLLAVLAAHYNFLKYAKLWELERQRPAGCAEKEKNES